MARSIPEDTIRRVKNTANIVDIIGESIVLKKAGRNYLGLCPFHAEKTPSFSVSPEKQIFYCFGCHTGGNVISFLMQHDGMTFPEAVRALAEKYGIEVPEEPLTPTQKEKQSEKEKIYRINEIATAFFRDVLKDPQQGQKAMSYLLGRGMTRKMIDGHFLGYAPNRWDGLLRHLQQKGVPPSLALKAGLIVARKERSGYYDRFRDRVIFPILNLSGQVLGFGGRVMGEEMPKYLNSPETPVYAKSRSLYGIHKARRAARASSKLYVVEGYFDVLAMHLYGVENTVATLGTALTSEHVQLLKGMVGQNGDVTLVYDSDEAGIKAAHRSIAVFEQGFLDARILVLPDGYDPDLYLREHGPDDFFKRADQALGMIPFLIESAIQRNGLSIEGKVKTVDDLQASLSSVTDTVARALYVKQVAERLDIAESAILEKIRSTPVKTGRHPAASNAGKTLKALVAEGVLLEQQILAMMLSYPVMIPEIIRRNILDNFEDGELKAIARMIAGRAAYEDQNVADMVSMIEDPRCRNLVTRLAMTENRWDRDGCRRVLAQFENRQRRRAKDDLQRQIEAAEKNNDVDLLGKLLRQKQIQAGKGMANL